MHPVSASSIEVGRRQVSECQADDSTRVKCCTNGRLLAQFIISQFPDQPFGAGSGEKWFDGTILSIWRTSSVVTSGSNSDRLHVEVHVSHAGIALKRLNQARCMMQKDVGEIQFGHFNCGRQIQVCLRKSTIFEQYLVISRWRYEKQSVTIKH